MKLASWFKSEVALYVATGLLAVLLLVPVLRLDQLDLRAPMQPGGDGAFYQGIIAKPLTTQGWYVQNPSLSAPDGLALYDFPTGTDSALFLMMKLIAVVVPDSAVVINVFYLLTYPLAALSMLFAARYFGISRPVAIALALLYAFAPYHFARGQGHLMLSAYFMLPVGLVVAFDIENAIGRFGVPGEQVRWRDAFMSRRFLVGCAVTVAAALTGVYYAFFYGATLIVVAIKRVVERRSWRPLILPAVLGVLLAATVVVSAAPTFAYQARNGANPFMEADRGPGGAEIYALRLIQLVLPPRGHRIPVFNAVAERYAEHLRNISPVLDNESGSAALGLIATAGFLFLLAWAVFGVAENRDGPWARYRLADLATVNLAMLLIGTAGGLGLLIASLISPMLRGYNRVSIFMAALALLAVGALVDRTAARYPKQKWLAAALAVTLLAVGLADQTQPVSAADYARASTEVSVVSGFGDAAERLLPEGSAVFQLPYVSFPGSAEAIATGFGEYTHLLPYIYSDGLKWSFGAMNGRATAAWQKRAAELPVDDMLGELRAKDFAAVYLDRNGYPDKGERVIAELDAALGTADVTSSDGRMLLWSLR